MRNMELWFPRPIREALVPFRKPQHLLFGQLIVHPPPDSAHFLGLGAPIGLIVVSLHTMNYPRTRNRRSVTHDTKTFSR
jgi:hypothetical protein